MIKETKKRVERLEAMHGTKQQELEERQRQEYLFHNINIILKEVSPDPPWHSLDPEKKWQVFSNPQNEFENQLCENVLRTMLQAVRSEIERRSAINLPVV